MKPPSQLLGLGIGAALVVAIGAASLLFRPGLFGLVYARAPRSRPAVGSRAERPAPPPPDFLDLCRTAGL